MTLLVRDEEDILASNLDFHLQQGVDFFIITDNLSVDGTPDIAHEYVRAGVAQYLHETGDDYSQHQWVTRMARMAALDHAADWVINSDADEFWLPANGFRTVKDALDSVSLNVSAVVVQRYNFVPLNWERGTDPIEEMIFRERESRGFSGEPLPPKVAHRALSDVSIDQGNHGVRRGSTALEGIDGPLRIFHYPLRYYKQFENKIAKGGAAYARNGEFAPGYGHAWRALYAIWQTGGLPAYFGTKILAPEQIQERLKNGTLVLDRTTADILTGVARLSGVRDS